MGYMHEVDEWLHALLYDLSKERITLDELKRAIREKLLESYRNGVQAGEAQSPAPRREERRPEDDRDRRGRRQFRRRA